MCHLLDADLAGKALRAALWRLRRTTGYGTCPLSKPATERGRAGTEKPDQDWLGSLIGWMWSTQLTIHDTYVHCSPTHRLLREGPKRPTTWTEEEGDRWAAQIELIDGYDWVQRGVGRSLTFTEDIEAEIAPRRQQRYTKRDDANLWRLQQMAETEARQWLNTVNATIGCKLVY